jgi:cytochrome c oxidase assembly factor CtaG
VHGDLAGALGTNALAVAAFGVFALFMVHWVVRVLRDRPVTVPLRTSHWWALGVLALAFTVVRNLPAGAALAP